MKKTLSALVLGLAPAVTWASTHDVGGHHMPAHGLAGHGTPPGMTSSPSLSGQPGDPAGVTRTIELTMDDTMRFIPDEIQVSAGETVRFFIRNTGKIPHEMVIGAMADLKAHAAQMRAMPGMRHAESNMITLGPKQMGGLVWKFDQAGVVDFACLIPGHLEAGMAGTVKVV